MGAWRGWRGPGPAGSGLVVASHPAAHSIPRLPLSPPQLRGIVATFRMTNRTQPTRPSHYAATILAPLQQFAKARAPLLGLVLFARGRATTLAHCLALHPPTHPPTKRPTHPHGAQGEAAARLSPAARAALAAAVVARVSGRYQQLADDTLRCMLRRAGHGGRVCRAVGGAHAVQCSCRCRPPLLACRPVCLPTHTPLPRPPCTRTRSTVRKTESSLKRLKTRQRGGEGGEGAWRGRGIGMGCGAVADEQLCTPQAPCWLWLLPRLPPPRLPRRTPPRPPPSPRSTDQPLPPLPPPWPRPHAQALAPPTLTR